MTDRQPKFELYTVVQHKASGREAIITKQQRPVCGVKRCPHPTCPTDWKNCDSYTPGGFTGKYNLSIDFDRKINDVPEELLELGDE